MITISTSSKYNYSPRCEPITYPGVWRTKLKKSTFGQGAYIVGRTDEKVLQKRLNWSMKTNACGEALRYEDM
jgi:hypothetical protein